MESYRGPDLDPNDPEALKAALKSLSDHLGLSKPAQSADELFGLVPQEEASLHDDPELTTEELQQALRLGAEDEESLWGTFLRHTRTRRLFADLAQVEGIVESLVTRRFASDHLAQQWRYHVLANAPRLGAAEFSASGDSWV